MNKKKFLSIICFVLATLFTTVGIIIIPGVTNLGTTILLYVLASLILGYVFFYLINKVKKYSGIRQILVVVEMVLDLVLVLSLIFNEFVTFLSVKEGFKVIGAVIWLHSAFVIMESYFSKNEKEFKFSFAALLFEIFLLTISTFIFIKPLFSNTELIVFISILSFAVSIVLSCLGFINLRTKKKGNELGLK